MNAQTNSQVVSPVLAILATTSFQCQPGKRQPVKKLKKLRNFDSFLQSADEAEDTSLLLLNGCYGKDAKPVVGNVSSFNQLF